jgi:hypothetical protein
MIRLPEVRGVENNKEVPDGVDSDTTGGRETMHVRVRGVDASEYAQRKISTM